MHSSIPFSGEYQPLFELLNEPLYVNSLLNADRTANPLNELSIECGYQLHCDDFASHPYIESLAAELRQFLDVAMELKEHATGIPIRLIQCPINEAEKPEQASQYEQHRIEVTKDGVTLAAANIDGIRRAIYRLESEMLIRSAPVLPLGTQTHSTSLRTRISRNPIAPYRWLSGWELEDAFDYYPENYLRRIARSGVNALWVPVLFRNLIASSIIPEMGPERHQLESLRQLVARTAAHGIRIYLFCIEPRILPHGHPVIYHYPELVGAERSLCISQPKVQEYLYDACRTLTREVPDLGGVINIFCGERLSNCWSNSKHVEGCERCRERTQAEIHSKVLNTMLAGLKSGNNRAELLAWTYLMASSTESKPITPMLDVMDVTDPRVIWLGNYEHGSSKVACGREVAVHEYSLSSLGPSPHFTALADHGRAKGHPLHAKLQLGNSYELSSLPWITVPGIVTDKISTALKHGVDGVMLGWIVGGFPGPMLRAAGEAAFTEEPKQALLRTAAVAWGEAQASTIVRAWEYFSEAWQAYPFHNALLYWGPITRAPAYPLYLEKESRLATPYNWGLDRQRHRQPFENHPSRWLGNYTSQEIVTTLRRMAEVWERGLLLIREALSSTPVRKETHREAHVAEATRLQLLAAANIYEFNTLRLELLEGNDAVLPRMSDIVSDELAHTEAMQVHMTAVPWIGYQSEIFGYSYSMAMLREKCEQLRHTLQRLCHWQLHGVERWILEKEIATVEFERPDDCPDLLGD